MSHTKKHAKRLVAYGRISTAQDLARQRQALKAYGCKVIFEDTASGKSLSGRPQLVRALDELRPGDCLVLAEWDRATTGHTTSAMVAHYVKAANQRKLATAAILKLENTK